MSTFNFTVRAMDDQKAYSDRQFSINVKNSLVNNLIVGGTADVFTTTDLDSVALTQRNGITPDNSFSGLSTQINRICYGNGIWCVQTSLTAYTISPDGINWTPYSLPSGYILAGGGGIQYVNNQFVVVMMLNDSSSGSIQTSGNSIAAVFTSDDLQTWTQLGGDISIAYNTMQTNPMYAPVPFKITFGQGRWVIGMSYNNWNASNSINTSNYGFSYDTTSATPVWTALFFPSIGSSIMGVPGGYQYINGMWIFGTSGTGPTSGSNVYFTSNDFTIWTERTLGSNLSYSYLCDFYYVNGVLVSVPVNKMSGTSIAGDPDTQGIFWSTDGITWNACSLPSLSRTSTMYGCYYNGKLILGSNSRDWLIESSDGKAFTRVNTPGTSTLLVLSEDVVGLGSIG